MLSGALERALSKRGLLGAGEAGAGEFELSVEIDRYEPGNAFKRWLMPGYGPTVLRVRGELVDPGTGEVVTDIDHQRRVEVGGGFTIGAWRWIFDQVATDLAKDFAKHRTAAEFVAHDFVDDDEPAGLSTNLAVAPRPPS
jgi:hypothetical protein